MENKAGTADTLSKDECYSQMSVGNRKFFECHICHRKISSKRNVLYHLYSSHGKSPMKRVKKQYMDDPRIQIPRTTLRRKIILQSSSTSQNSCLEIDYTVNNTLDHNSESNSFDHNSESSNPESNTFDNNSESSSPESNTFDHSSETTKNYQDNNTDNRTNHNNNISDTEGSGMDRLQRNIQNSGTESDDDSSTHSSISYSSTDISDLSSDVDSDVSDQPEFSNNSDNENESTQSMGRDAVEMSLLACFLKNNISGSAS